MTSIKILSPVAPTRVVERPLANRRADLPGRHIGLLDNQKANAAGLLDEVGRELVDRYPTLTITREHKIATSPSPPDVMERMRTYDAVVLAIAD
jgi:hypothetical protein